MANEMVERVARSGDLRVWWVPQLPMKAFYVDVPDIRSADLILSALGRYDAFQFEHRVKPDYCNAGGLEQFDADAGEWLDWECPFTLDGFDQVRCDPARMSATMIDAALSEPMP